MRSSSIVSAAFLSLLAASSTASAQKILHTTTGTGAKSAFGTTALAGDLDHDGKPDLLVAAPFDDTSAEDAGRVVVLSGADSHALFTFSGTAAGELFGSAVAGVGDADGDGTADLLIGAPGQGAMAGRVRLYSGANGALLRVFSAGEAGDRFGAAVGGARDLDGDGLADLLIGAPGADGTAPDMGKLYMYTGDTGLLLHVIGGSHPGDQLGASVGNDASGVQFVDSEPGLIIGCTQDGAGGSGAGAVEVHSATTFALVHLLTGGAAGDLFGRSVARAGDVDHDGVDDIAVGSSGGYARVHSGSTGAVLATYTGSAASGFGRVIAGIGDVNGDNYADIAVGEPLADVNGTDSGTLHLYSGHDGSKLQVVHGPAPQSLCGTSIACAGDLNADAIADVAVGAPGPGPGGTAPGQVFTLSLTRWENMGAGLPGVLGIPHLEGQGGLVASTQVNLALTGARSLAGVTLVLGKGVFIDSAKSALTPVPDIVTAGLLTNAVGALNYAFTWPAGMSTGQTLYYQFRIADPAAPGGESRSNTMAGTVP